MLLKFCKYYNFELKKREKESNRALFSHFRMEIRGKRK